MFVWLMVAAVGHVCFSFSIDFRIVSHSPFSWQNRLWDSKPVNKGGNLDIRISRNSTELHHAPCMRVACHMCGLGPSCTLKQNFLSLTLLIPLAKLTNKKRGICRHCISYPLRLGASFPNDDKILKPKVGLGPDQIRIDLRKVL